MRTNKHVRRNGAVPASRGWQGRLETGREAEQRAAKIGIVVVAYNAAATLAKVLDRIPADFRSRVAEVIVCDDASDDATYLVGMGYRAVMADLPLTVVRNPVNRGYGGNQKVGYHLAIEHGLDVVVLLHGDGQYAPELLPEMVAPIVEGEADAVFGSRMLVPGAARRGGMPLYKRVGNKVLTAVQNRLVGAALSEFHSGYRAYSVRALEAIDFERNSEGFDFDTQIIIQLHHRRLRIVEIPIPTYYGDEICYVNGLDYARRILLHSLRYFCYRSVGIGLAPNSPLPEAVETSRYDWKAEASSSHDRAVERLRGREPQKVLDLGCGPGWVAGALRSLGHEVVGVDRVAHPNWADALSSRIVCDLERELHRLETEAPGPFDVVLALDVLEHLRNPVEVLQAAAARLRPGGALLVSVPNGVHLYVRARVLLGALDYDERGILDSTHVRFYTRRSFARLIAEAGLELRSCEAVPSPIGSPAASGGRLGWALARLEGMACAFWPSLFAYQWFAEARVREPATVIVSPPREVAPSAVGAAEERTLP